MKIDLEKDLIILTIMKQIARFNERDIRYMVYQTYKLLEDSDGPYPSVPRVQDYELLFIIKNALETMTIEQLEKIQNQITIVNKINQHRD